MYSNTYVKTMGVRMDIYEVLRVSFMEKINPEKLLGALHPSLLYVAGAFRTGGAGCWIKIRSCPSDHSLEGFFFDAWGASNLLTGQSQLIGATVI